MSLNLSHIKSSEALRQEQFRVRERLKLQEKDFKKRFQQLPAEIAAASANNLIPRFLRGKVTDTALNGGKFLINKFFVADDDHNKSLITQTRETGVIPFVKTVFRMFKGKK